MRKELDRLAEQIRLKVQKHIKCSDGKWTQEALLRLIHIEKGNVAQRKSAKVSNDRWRPTPLRNLTGNAKVVISRKGPATSSRPDLTIHDRKRRSSEKDAAGREYMNTSNWMCADYKCRVSPKYCKHNLPILAERRFSLYNFSHLSRNGSVRKI